MEKSIVDEPGRGIHIKGGRACTSKHLPSQWLAISALLDRRSVKAMPDLIKTPVIFFDRATCASTHRSVGALHLVPALDSLKSMGFCEIRIRTSLPLSPLEYDNRRLKWWQA